MLEPVRESYRSGKSLIWTRVNKMPDYVYFDHSIHINKGVGCNDCHGPVDRMPLMYAQNTLLMEWCLNCHRAPEKFLRPRDQVFNMQYQQPTPRFPGGRGRRHLHGPDRSGQLPEDQTSITQRSGHYQLLHLSPLEASAKAQRENGPQERENGHGEHTKLERFPSKRKRREVARKLPMRKSGPQYCAEPGRAGPNRNSAAGHREFPLAGVGVAGPRFPPRLSEADGGLVGAGRDLDDLRAACRWNPSSRMSGSPKS